MPATRIPALEVTSTTAELIADLVLLPKHFTRTGIIERLVAQLTEKDLALSAAQAELAARDIAAAAAANSLVVDEVMTPANDIGAQLAAWVAARGWTAKTAKDHAAFDGFMRRLVNADTFIGGLFSVDEMVDAFIAANTPSTE